MGAHSLEGMLDAGVDLDTTLAWHLQYNHYPSIPLSMIEPCKAAIEAANNGEPDLEIRLPDGISYRGQATAAAYIIIEHHHLDSFLGD